MPAGCGRTDFQGGSAETLFDSVRQRLFTLPAETTVRQRIFAMPFCTKNAIILPRQARDKHT